MLHRDNDRAGAGAFSSSGGGLLSGVTWLATGVVSAGTATGAFSGRASSSSCGGAFFGVDALGGAAEGRGGGEAFSGRAFSGSGGGADFGVGAVSNA